MTSDDLETPGSAAPRCPAPVEAAAFLAALGSAFAIAVVFVAYPLLYIKYQPYIHTMLLGLPIAVLCVFNIGTAFYTQKGSLWAYYSLLTVMPVVALAFLLQGQSPVPAMITLLLLLWGYNSFMQFWDQQEYQKIIDRYGCRSSVKAPETA